MHLPQTITQHWFVSFSLCITFSFFIITHDQCGSQLRIYIHAIWWPLWSV